MTSSNLMSLPLDIPWQRLATSADMLDHTYGDSSYPPKWLTSLTVFFYEPPDEEQLYPDRTITFLKVSCSIAGLLINLAGTAMAVDPQRLRDCPAWIQFWDKTKDLSMPCPCLAALLQVAVFPGQHPEQESLENYPIIMDFEPKKREMYESAVENKQFMSASRATLGVKKSSKVVESQEMGISMNMSASVSDNGTGAGLGLGVTNKSGTSYETVDSLSLDFSREKREDYSYTTNLTHMYHLLNSYHVGTNRAMFAIQPRPHVTDDEFIFFGGPQKLEGIQEFFLVVDRPHSVTRLCVEATLETAHVQMTKTYTARVIPHSQLTQGDNATKTAAALNLTGSQRDSHLEALVYGGEGYPGWNNIAPGTRQTVLQNISAGGSSLAEFQKTQQQLQLDLGIPAKNITQAEWDNIVEISNHGGFSIQLPVGVTENLDVIYEFGPAKGHIAVLGRTTAGCLQHRIVASPSLLVAEISPSLVAERVLDVPYEMLDMSATNGRRAIAANRFSQDVADIMLECASARDRLPYGVAGIQDATFVQETLIAGLTALDDDDPYNVRIDEIEGIDPEVRAQLAERYGAVWRLDALSIDMTELHAGLGLSDIQARQLRSQLIGDGPGFESPPRSEFVTVPNLVGIPIPKARRVLIGTGLAHGEIVSEPAMQPQDVVLGQYPAAGQQVPRGVQISVVVSSGPVSVPDVVGVRVEDAIRQVAEQELRIESKSLDGDGKAGIVLSITPAPGTLVPRQSQVVLLIGNSEIARTSGNGGRVSHAGGAPRQRSARRR